MNENEVAGLRKAFNHHIQTNGTLFGFVHWLLQGVNFEDLPEGATEEFNDPADSGYDDGEGDVNPE